MPTTKVNQRQSVHPAIIVCMYTKVTSYHCLFCHGFKDTSAHSAALLAIDPMTPAFANHSARFVSQFAKTIIIYTNGSEELAHAITALVEMKPNITLNARPITRLTTMSPDADADVAVEFEDGEVAGACAEDGAECGVCGGVGGARTYGGGGWEVKTQMPFFETSVGGYSVVGDCGSPFKAVALGVAAQVLVLG